MSDEYRLIFHPATEMPSRHENGKDFLLFNVCDGYHVAEWIQLDDEPGEFWGWYGGERRYDMFYNAWARLPSGAIDHMQAFRAYQSHPRPATPEETV